MKVLVINGSPKGKNSITLQTVLFLEKKFKDDEFEIINVGSSIKTIDKENSFEMNKIIEKINQIDIILFSYPVYTFLVPSQLQRFIELLKEKDLDLNNKYCTQITTSLHFYDVTAHMYIKENSLDLGLKYIDGLSSDMSDLLKEKGQHTAITFWNYVKYSISNNLYINKTSESKDCKLEKHIYQPVLENIIKSDKYNITIVTNCSKEDINLNNMIFDFQRVFKYNTKIINITEFPFSGGCLGCFNCATTGKCIYKDGFDKFLREEIQTSNAIIYAFTIRDHSMGADFKMYDDRQFCNGHRTVTAGMPIGYIISGGYSQESNLQMVIEGRSQVGQNFLAHVATDEVNPQKELIKLASKLSYAIESNLLLPSNFFGVGGMKIFRDLIYVMQGLMKEDHKFYKKHKIYDFPQKQKGTIIKMKLVGSLISIPAVKKKMGNKMTEAIIAPYKKVLEKIDKNSGVNDGRA